MHETTLPEESSLLILDPGVEAQEIADDRACCASGRPSASA